MAAARWTPQRRETVVMLLLQVLMLVLFALFTSYKDNRSSERMSVDADIKHFYPLFQDVHIMMFVGFGFLMTFLKRYGYSAVSLNLLLAALVLQWALLCRGFWDREQLRAGKIVIGVDNLLGADLTAAAILISMGAVLGKTTPLQLLLMGFVETAICTANEHLGTKIFKAVDAGGSMFVHVFGAYFGLTVSWMLGHGSSIRKGVAGALEGASYNSDIFAMIGSIFLWCFWPSFNGATVEGEEQSRAMVNTYLALASCCVTAFLVSALSQSHSKFDMVHVQNATLAGGVAVGTSCNMLLTPCGAIAVGILAGILSVVGYRYLQPWLLRRLSVHDTCGVHNLHGMPGVLAGLVGVVAASLASSEDYGASLFRVFPAMATREHNATSVLTGRTAGQQARVQLLALGVTFVIATVAGAIVGFFVRLSCLDKVPPPHLFADDYLWEVPDKEVEVQTTNNTTHQQEENKMATVLSVSSSSGVVNNGVELMDEETAFTPDGRLHM